jgi:hypothetical protein
VAPSSAVDGGWILNIANSSIIGFVCAALLCGCGGAEQGTAKKPKRVKVEVPFFRVQSIGPLAEAATRMQVPFLLGPGGAALDTPCFGRATGLTPWETRRPVVLEKLAENQAAISKAIAAWVDAEILAPAPLAALRGGLQASYEDPIVLNAPDAKVRLAPDQTCVDEKTRFLPDGAKAVTTLFGAKVIVLRGKEALTKPELKALRKAAKRADVGFRPSRGFRRAVDPASGAFAATESGAPLFVGPDGKPVTEDRLPPEEDRPLAGFELVMYEPLWFAWGDLPQEKWRKESDPAVCRVNLVDYDATPRVPACDPNREAGFGVEPGEGEGAVVLKVASDGVVSTKTAKYGEATMIQVGSRVVVWVTATPIEEGADLAVDSLVLDPKKDPEGELGAFGTPAPEKRKKRH